VEASRTGFIDDIAQEDSGAPVRRESYERPMVGKMLLGGILIVLMHYDLS
jgi:hypothetical protein